VAPDTSLLTPPNPFGTCYSPGRTSRMKLPNWFRIAWWAALVLLVGELLFARRDDLLTGRAVPADVFIFLVLVALLLVPLFQEINLFGLKLKQEVAALKADVAGLRADIRNTVDLRTEISPTFNIPSPPPDEDLPALEERIGRVLKQVLTERGVPVSDFPPTPPTDIPPDVLVLFNIRYQLEREIRRIWERSLTALANDRPRMSVVEMARLLAADGRIPSSLVSMLRQVYSVANPAVHGQAVSAAQMDFVKGVAPRILNFLRTYPDG